MAKIVKKLFGHSNFPEKVHVLKEAAEFDHRGLAKVSDEASKVFDELPGYELLGEAAEEGIEVLATEDKTEAKEEDKVEDTEPENIEEVDTEETTEADDNTEMPKLKKLKKAVPR